jgi:putative ABC transport system permease protein
VAVYPNVDIAVGAGIKSVFPEVKSFTRLTHTGPEFIKFNDKKFKEERMAYADSNILSFFSIPLIEGNISNALSDPNSIVISSAFAKKYFGEDPVLGKSLMTGKNTILKITGVFDKIPDNSHFHFDAFLSFSTLHIANQTWSNVGINAWVFPLSGTAAVLIALLTISFQAIKASIANPVTSLRSE